MSNNDNVRNKIIILYILAKIPGISVGKLTGMAIDTCYMNYFEFASAVDELEKNKLISISVRKAEKIKNSDGKPVKRCDITSAGSNTLDRLYHLIPDHIHTFLNKAFVRWNKEVKKEAEIRADHYPDLYGGYIVDLGLTDGDRDIINLSLSVPSKEMAQGVCGSWKKDTEQTYRKILSILYKDE